jgi:uncharacterized protein
MSYMRLEWDEAKNVLNMQKHGYDFNDADTLFVGDRLEFLDDRYDYGELRYISLGTIEGRLVVAVYTRRPSAIRLISLRKANSREKERFRKYIKNRLGTS